MDATDTEVKAKEPTLAEKDAALPNGIMSAHVESRLCAFDPTKTDINLLFALIKSIEIFGNGGGHVTRYGPTKLWTDNEKVKLLDAWAMGRYWYDSKPHPIERWHSSGVPKRYTSIEDIKSAFYNEEPWAGNWAARLEFLKSTDYDTRALMAECGFSELEEQRAYVKSINAECLNFEQEAAELKLAYDKRKAREWAEIKAAHAKAREESDDSLTDAVTIEPADDVKWIYDATFDDEEVESEGVNLEFLMDGIFPTDGIHDLLGGRDNYKSTFLAGLVEALINDRPTFAGVKIDQGWTVLYLCGEMYPAHKARMAAGRKLRSSKPRLERLITFRRRADLTDPKWTEAVIEMLRTKYGVEDKLLVVVDTWQKYVGDLMSPSQVNAAQVNLEAIYSAFGGCAIRAMHPPAHDETRNHGLETQGNATGGGALIKALSDQECRLDTTRNKYNMPGDRQPLSMKIGRIEIEGAPSPVPVIAMTPQEQAQEATETPKRQPVTNRGDRTPKAPRAKPSSKEQTLIRKLALKPGDHEWSAVINTALDKRVARDRYQARRELEKVFKSPATVDGLFYEVQTDGANGLGRQRVLRVQVEN